MLIIDIIHLQDIWLDFFLFWPDYYLGLGIKCSQSFMNLKSLKSKILYINIIYQI